MKLGDQITAVIVLAFAIFCGIWSLVAWLYLGDAEGAIWGAGLGVVALLLSGGIWRTRGE